MTISSEEQSISSRHTPCPGNAAAPHKTPAAAGVHTPSLSTHLSGPVRRPHDRPLSVSLPSSQLFSPLLMLATVDSPRPKRNVSLSDTPTLSCPLSSHHLHQHYHHPPSSKSYSSTAPRTKEATHPRRAPHPQPQLPFPFPLHPRIIMVSTVLPHTQPLPSTVALPRRRLP